MNIIDASEAREITNKYISPEIEQAVQYIMERIATTAESGDHMIVFICAYTPKCYWDAFVTKEFKRFIENHGYEYTYYPAARPGSDFKRVIISW